MPDDASARENVIAVSFSEDANAYEALSRLKELDTRGDVGVQGAAVVVRDDDGKIVTKDQIGDESVEGTRRWRVRRPAGRRAWRPARSPRGWRDRSARRLAVRRGRHR